MKDENWLIYALGGGWGHLNRALALARIAVGDRDIKILTNSSYLTYIDRELLAPGIFLESISPEIDFIDTCIQIRSVLNPADYNCLIVDTFPRGLGGEIATLLPQLQKIPRILIHRDIQPYYVEEKKLSEFVSKYYNRIIIPGEGLDLPLVNYPLAQHTNPWLIRSADELPDRETARLMLGVNPEEKETKIVVVLASGRGEELSFYGRLTQILADSFESAIVRCISAVKPMDCDDSLWMFHWPAIECLVAADVVVGGGGYNTVYECLALGLPLVAFPFKRLYDRQGLRVQRVRKNYDKKGGEKMVLVESVESAIAAIHRLLSLNKSDENPPNFINGAMSAVKAIEEILSKPIP